MVQHGKDITFKYILKNICYLLLTFFIFVGMVEIILRTTHLFGARISWIMPDPTVGWRHTPGKNYWYNEENDHAISGKINNFGWRDKDWTLKKLPDVYRVAVLGDSFVEAMQVELNHTFLSLAEKKLNEQYNIRTELMNFGRSGFSQAEELIVLKSEVMQFDPDMIILFFCISNDIDDINKNTTSNSLRPFYSISADDELILDASFVMTREFKMKSMINWLKQHSILLSFVTEKYNLFNKQRLIHKIESPKNEERIKGALTLSTGNPDHVYAENYKLNKRLIREMADFCREKGIKFMLVSLNTADYMPEVENKYKSIDSTFDMYFFYDDMMNYTRQLDIEYLGLQKVFREQYKKNGIPLHWSHWNYEGHKVVSDALSDKLKSIIVKE